MYHALLTNRYLTSRVIPLIAVAAVALCVALVIVVVSVMTGFLDMVRNSGRKLIGDVVIACPVNGIPYYDRLIKRIDQLPQAAAATPVCESWGLLKMPYPDGPQKQTETVQIWGVEPESFSKVTGYADSLHWKDLPKDQWDRLFDDVLGLHWKETLASMSVDQRVQMIMKVLPLDAPPSHAAPDEARVRERVPTMKEEDWSPVFMRLRSEPALVQSILTAEQWQALLSGDPRLIQPGPIVKDGQIIEPSQIMKDGLTLTRNGRPGICMGIHVSEGNERTHEGGYIIKAHGFWWMPAFDVTLTTIPIEAGSLNAESESRILPVCNEFKSDVFLIDSKRVMAPLAVVQQLLHLDDQGMKLDKDGNAIGVVPAKATLVLVRAKDGVTPEQLRDTVETAYQQFQREIVEDSTATVFPPSLGLGLSVKTWAQQQAEFIGPVEKERELMRTLFSIVYFVCAALVLSIFWAIVYEKTRDIGILRSVGASRGGIVWIFLRYGLIVGVIGSIVGLGLAFVTVHYINAIHEALGHPPLAIAVVVLTLAAVAIMLTIALSMQGRLLPLVVGTLGSVTLVGLGIGALILRHYGGFVIWDPAVYYFTKIPSSMDLTTAYTTMIGAVAFSLLGAAVPAAKAADTDPVQALRYE
jgi:lipoprotein-releasing system permease protein